MTVRWEEMFPQELDDRLARCPVVYLTYGLCEPHGLHNALGLDAIKAHEIACRAAMEHGGIVAPPFFWHVHELGYHASFGEHCIGDRNPWLTSLPPWVLYKLFLYQLRTVAARGFQAAIVLTGHYGGNEHDFKRVANVFMGHSPLRVWAGADHEAISFEDFHGDHAGRCETSQLWALRPELVDMSRLPAGDPRDIERIMATGGDAGRASIEAGEGIIRSQIAWLGQKARDLLAAYSPPPTPASPTPGNPIGALTFDQVERIWVEEIEPVLPRFVSMRRWEGQAPVASDSPWSSNERSDFPGERTGRRRH